MMTRFPVARAPMDRPLLDEPTEGIQPCRPRAHGPASVVNLSRLRRQFGCNAAASSKRGQISVERCFASNGKNRMKLGTRGDRAPAEARNKTSGRGFRFRNGRAKSALRRARFNSQSSVPPIPASKFGVCRCRLNRAAHSRSKVCSADATKNQFPSQFKAAPN